MRIREYQFQFTVIFLFSACQTGCLMGPNFHKPCPPPVSSYTQKPLPSRTVSIATLGKGGVSQTFDYGKEISPQWWYLFHSPEINTLIERGIRNSPNLEAAQAALLAAQEAVNVQIGNSLFPAIDASLSGQRQRFAGVSIGSSSSSIFNVFNAAVNVSYTLDVFGAARRQIEALQAQVNYQQFQLLAAYLTLTTNIVTTAVAVASFEEQIKATRELVKIFDGQLKIIQKQFELGGVSIASVLTQKTLTEQTRATIPPLEKSLAQQQHALDVLVGSFPNVPIPKIHLNSLILPTSIPVSFPSRIVQQRPDIRASEALLHAATAQVGVATANLFPQFTLTGAYGWSGTAPARLFSINTNFWNYGAQITQPLFHGGALLAQRRENIDLMNQAAAQYREVVLQAFQNVADSLKAIETDARTLQAQRAAELAAHRALKINQEQYILGGASYLSLLITQQKYITTHIDRIRTQATRYQDTAALFQSLGGGWWNRCVTPCDPVNPLCANRYCP